MKNGKFIFTALVLTVIVFTGCQFMQPPPAPTETFEPPQSHKDTKVAVEVVGESDEDTTAADASEAGDAIAPVYKEFSTSEYNALKGNKPFVIFFYADSSPVCSEMDKTITEDLATFPEGTLILKANFDEEDALKDEFNVKDASTVIVFDGADNVVYTAQDPAFDDFKAAIKRSFLNP